MPQIQTLDPITLARFMVLPGAAELIAAFSAIPPGRLRETVIQHAQALADAHEAAPAHQRAPDPLAVFGAAPVARRPALPRPAQTPAAAPVTQDTPPAKVRTQDPGVKAVELMLAGVPVHKAAEETGLTFKEVFAARKAGRAAGLKFPDVRSKPHTVQVYNSHFDTSPKSLSPTVQRTMMRAAESRGISLDAYMARRKLALEMAQAGRHFRAIMEATKESRTTLGNWFSVARGAGHYVPYMVDTVSPADAPNVRPVESPAEVVNITAARKTRSRATNLNFIVSDSEARAGNRHQIDLAARALGLDREGYFALREKALGLYRQGIGPSEVAKTLGIGNKQSNNWRDRAKAAGLLVQTKNRA
jgi:hypothetical protein